MAVGGPKPNFEFEEDCEPPVCGVDEAGRGPLAGPVVAAAVILDRTSMPDGLDDSKRLTAARRRALLADLMSVAMIGVGSASVEEIDQINILNATMLAMRRALEALPVTPMVALVDGNRCPDLPCQARAVVKGDQRCLSIAAASIVAKVHRDAVMADLAATYPAYGWRRNAGYGTAEHLAALRSHGPTSHHRRSFAPVRAVLV
jgi:ribonuclease HII